MKRLNLVGTALAGIALLVSGCDEGTEPTAPSDVKTLSPEAQQALVAALEEGGSLGALGGFGSAIVSQVRSVGSIKVTHATPAGAPAAAAAASQETEYDATGLQIDLNLTDPEDPLDLELTGLLLWSGVNEQAGTVEETIVILAAGVEPGQYLLDDLDLDTKTGGRAFVSHEEGDTRSVYVSTGGTFTLTEVSFGDPEDCSGAPESGLTCGRAEGTMSGSFDFTAIGFPPDESESYAGDYDVPAVRLTLSGTPGTP